MQRTKMVLHDGQEGGTEHIENDLSERASAEDDLELIKHFDRYLKISLRNYARNWVDKHNRRTRGKMDMEEVLDRLGEIADSSTVQSPLVVAARGESFIIYDDELYRVLMEIPEAKREVILFFYFYGDSLTSLATNWGVSRKTIGHWRNEAVKYIADHYSVDIADE